MLGIITDVSWTEPDVSVVDGSAARLPADIGQDRGPKAIGRSIGSADEGVCLVQQATWRFPMTSPKPGVGQEMVEVPVGDLGHHIGIVGGGHIIAGADIVRSTVVRTILPSWRWLLRWLVVDRCAAYQESGKEVELHRVPTECAAAAKEAGNGGWKDQKAKVKRQRMVAFFMVSAAAGSRRQPCRTRGREEAAQ